MRLAAGIVTAAVLCVANPGARAQSANPLVDKALELLEELEFDKALTILEKAIEDGGNNPSTIAEVYRLTGEIRATLGKRKAAIESFKFALVIDPQITLEKGSSPKITKPFKAAKKFINNNAPIKVRHAITSTDPPTVALVVVSDPLDMVVEAHATYWNSDDKRGTTKASGKARIDIVLPKGTVKVMLAAVDRYGNRLAEVGSSETPIELEVPEDEPDPDPITDPDVTRHSTSDSPPLYANWMVWGGVSVVFAGVGTWAGLSARKKMDALDVITQQSPMFEFSQAKALEDKAKSRALIANITFGLAGAAAVAAAILFVKGGKSKTSMEESEKSEGAMIVPTIGDGTVGVQATLRF